MKQILENSVGKKIVSSFAVFYIVTTLLSCSHLASENIDRKAVDLDFTRDVITGKGFQHVAYFKDADVPSQSLHIYLEGDGTPWISHNRVNDDPTPRNPLMLDLMALDSGPAVYLGRPCYYGMANNLQCEPELWTSGRYSQQVVDSMVAALNVILEEFSDQIVLIGHSGGGTIAMLMAEQLSQVEGVITIAGNLDIEAWAHSHNYLPLNLSLNPSKRAPLNPDIFQLHLVGEVDRIISPEMIRSATDHQTNTEVRVVAGFNHICCWTDIWPDILAQIISK